MPVLKSPKHEAFVRNILKGMSQREAYLKAGFTAKNMESADANASRLISTDKVSARLTELQTIVTEKAVEKAAVSKEAVLSELAKIGFANMLDYVRVQESSGDAYVDFSRLTREQAAAIGEITVEEYSEGRGEDARDVKKVKFKLLDKKGALVDLGKHLGLFIERHEHGGPGDFSNFTEEELLTEDERLSQQLAAAVHDGPDTVN